MNSKGRKAVIAAVINQPTLLQEMTRNGFDWSADLSALVEILKLSFSKPSANIEQDAFLTALEIADALGGGQFYMPRADSVKLELRNLLIHQEFNGRNQAELMNKYDISRRALTSILAHNIRKSRPELRLKPSTPEKALPPPTVDKSWPQSIVTICNVIRDSLSAIDIQDEEIVLNIALGITRSFGGAQRYFPKSICIERYLLERQVFAKRQEGLKVKDIARMHGLTRKNVYDICSRIETKLQSGIEQPA